MPDTTQYQQINCHDETAYAPFVWECRARSSATQVVVTQEGTNLWALAVGQDQCVFFPEVLSPLPVDSAAAASCALSLSGTRGC